MPWKNAEEIGPKWFFLLPVTFWGWLIKMADVQYCRQKLKTDLISGGYNIYQKEDELILDEQVLGGGGGFFF